MSNIKRLFKPKINRVITGLAIVVIIVVGSYLAYKNGVFADTASATCQYTLSQMIPVATYNNVYLTDSASANIVLQNPSTTNFTYLKILHSVGDSYTSSTAQTLFVVGHKADGTATVSGGMDCIPPTRVGNFYISANLPTAVITTSFVANASAGSGNAGPGENTTPTCPSRQVNVSSFNQTTNQPAQTCMPCSSITPNQADFYVDSATYATACSDPKPTSSDGLPPEAADGATRCVKVNSTEIIYTRRNSLWYTAAAPSDSKPYSDLEINRLLSDPASKCASNSSPLVATASNPTSSGSLPDGATTSTTNPKTNPKAINQDGISQEPVIPVSGTQAAAVQYKNKINFTAYRESYAETNHVVPMGGATFTVQGFSSALPGAMTPISGLQTSAAANGITSASQLKCSTVNNFIAGTYGRLTNSYSRSFTTPDNGGKSLYTQTLNVPPGYYRVSYRKSGFGSTSTAEQTLCFQVGTSDGVSTPISINALLYAQPGAEPPGIMNPEFNGGIWYDNTVNSKDEYKTLIDKVPYKYMPNYPWYGWQKDDGTVTYDTGAPVGTMSDGTSVSGNPPNYGTGPNLPQYLSQCQNAEIELGNVDRNDLAVFGGLVGAYDGIRNNDDWLGIAGRTGLGALIGLGAGSILGNSGINVSINIGQLNARCQALYDSAIPPQCRSCFINGVYNASTCHRDCIQQVPYMQALLQGNSTFFGNN